MNDERFAGGSDDTLVYSLAQASTRLGVSPASLRRIIGRGELPTVRIGGRVLIRRDHLHELIERATVGAPGRGRDGSGAVDRTKRGDA